MAAPSDTATKWLLGGKPAQGPRMALAAGPVTAEFEPDTGFLRYIRLGEQELVRGVYAAVRDHNWGTVAPRIGELTSKIETDRFEVRFVAKCREGDVDFRWRGQIQGNPDGTVTYRFSGEAVRAFRTNRVGFCVLHPLGSLPGRPCRIEKVDGTVAESAFPDRIAPHQPFKELRAITHEVEPGLSVEVRMTGETFEMEDQRNWTDASYKTYCRPLELPFPVSVKPGERIEQTVEIRILGTPKRRAATRVAPPPTLVLLDTAKPLPAIGIGHTSRVEPLDEAELARLRLLRPAHLRVDLDLWQPVFAERLRRADEEAAAIGSDLEVALHLGDAAEAEVRAMVVRLPNLRSRIARFLVFHSKEKSTSARWGHLAQRLLWPSFPGVPIGLGTDAFFAELNRGRPDPEAADLLSYSINPQVHASDEASIVETLEAQTMTVASARAFSAGRPVVVSPVTLRMRFNPNATGPEPEPRPGELPPSVDPRQKSLFAAAWTLGSIRALAEGGAASVTFYETTGGRGVMEGKAGPVFPVFHVLADVCERPAAQFLPFRSSRPLSVQGMTLRSGDRHRVLLANLEPRACRVRCVQLPTARRFRTRSLDLASVVEATGSPEHYRHRSFSTVTSSPGGEGELELAPFAVLTLDEEE